MCIVENTTYVYSDGESLTKQRLKACRESRNGEPCNFETYKDLGEKYVREIRRPSTSPKSPSFSSASGRGPSTKRNKEKEKRPRSYLGRGADIFFGTGKEKSGKHNRRSYHKYRDNDAYGSYATEADELSRPRRRYSLSGGSIDTTAFKGPETPPSSTHAGPSKVASVPRVHSPLSPPRSPGSPWIQQSGTAIYEYPSSPSTPSRLHPTNLAASPAEAGEGPYVADVKPAVRYGRKTVIINNSRSKDEDIGRPDIKDSRTYPKGGKYVMSGARNFTQPGPPAPNTPPITPERPDNEHQDRGAAREQSRAERRASYREMGREKKLDEHEEREQARYKFREDERRRKAEQREREERERAQQSRASSSSSSTSSYDYEEGERERKEMEELCEEELRRQKREGKRPVYRASPAGSDPFPIGHPPAEPRTAKPSRHRHSQSAPIKQARSDDLAATKEQMARERAAAEARERQEAREDAAYYQQAWAQASYEAGRSPRYRPGLSPTIPAAPRYRETPTTQSPPYKLDHISGGRKLRRPSTADALYSKPCDPSAACSSCHCMPAAAAVPAAAVPVNSLYQQPYGLSNPHSPRESYTTYHGPSLPSTVAATSHQQPFQQYVMSRPDMLRKRGASVVAAAAAEEYRARDGYGAHAGLLSGFGDLRVGDGGPGYRGGGGGGGGGGIRRRGTISGDGRGSIYREQRGWRY